MSGSQIGSGRFSCELGTHTQCGADLGTRVEVEKELGETVPFHDVHAGARSVVRLIRAPVGCPPLVQMVVLTVRNATGKEQEPSPCFLR